MLTLATAALLAALPLQDAPQPAPTPVRLQLSAGRGGALTLVVRNANRRTLNLNFGLSLANGAAQYPTSLSLTIVDGSKSRTLPYARGLGVTGGRIDDMIVPLLGLSSYEIPLNVTDFAEPHDGPVNPLPTSFRAFVTLQSRAPSHVNLDMQGVKVMELWEGEVGSNMVDVDLAVKGGVNR